MVIKMLDNSISKYMSFKVRCLKNYIYTIDNNYLEKELSDKYLDIYLKTYINTYYYHILETLDYTELLKYDSKTIYKELEGKYYEILFYIENSDVLDSSEVYKSKKNQAKYCFQLVYFISYIDVYQLFLEEDYEKFILMLDSICNKNKYINDLIDAYKYQKLFDLLKIERIKINQFKNSLKDLKFYLNFNKYKDLDYYLVLLENNIPRLNNYYKKEMVDRVYSFKKISHIKTKTTLNLLIKDILKRVIYHKDIDKYFIILEENDLLDKKYYEEYFTLINNPILKSNIIFLINYKTYLSHTKIINDYNTYNFGIICDLSHVNDIEKKLDSLDNLPIIKYLILDKYKRDDFDFINKYEFSKECFYNKFEGK